MTPAVMSDATPAPKRPILLYVLVALGLVVLVGALAGVKATQIGSLIKAGEAMEKAGPPPEAVATAVAQEQTWEGALSAVGTVSATKGVTVSNDAPGVVSAIHFESGAVVRAGQVLAELDSGVERAQLASAKARRELALLNVQRSRTLLEGGAISSAQLDNEEAQLKTLSADADALQAQIARKVVKAPFAGRLGIRAINLGQFLNAGTALTTLEAMEALFIDFSLPQQHLADVAVGSAVRVSVASPSAAGARAPAGPGATPPPGAGAPLAPPAGSAGPPPAGSARSPKGAEGATFEGRVAAIDPGVDATTRSIKVRASVPNQHEQLRPGMFVTVSVVLPQQQQAKVVVVPATAIVHASYGDSVFVVEAPKAGAAPGPGGGPPPQIARQQFVRLGAARGDFVAVVDGVKPGQEVVSAGAFKLRNNAPIKVNNDAVGAAPQLTPRPANS